MEKSFFEPAAFFGTFLRLLASFDISLENLFNFEASVEQDFVRC